MAVDRVNAAVTESQLTILALNSGSSSLKFGVYRVSPLSIEAILAGEAEAIGDGSWRFHAQDFQGRVIVSESQPIPGHAEAVARIGKLLADSGVTAPQAIGHRVVHGGPGLRRHCRVDASVLSQLEAAAPFAPLHTPTARAVIAFAQSHFPGLPQVVCFDTAFHAGMPDVARVLPIPKELQSEGIQRYGFHGLSCESIVRQLGDRLPERLIIAHLGNGASVTAVRSGKSIDTSMGLTPSGGVMMGTRSGDLDPGVMIYLMRHKKLDATLLENLIDRRSGLNGISGVGGDMRELHRAAPGNADARLAIRMFCYSVRKQIAAMAAALGGLDLLVFTGGIGENDEAVRAEICENLRWMGVGLDRAQSGHTADSGEQGVPAGRVRVVLSREDEEIARHSWALVLDSPA